MGKPNYSRRKQTTINLSPNPRKLWSNRLRITLSGDIMATHAKAKHTANDASHDYPHAPSPHPRHGGVKPLLDAWEKVLVGVGIVYNMVFVRRATRASAAST